MRCGARWRRYYFLDPSESATSTPHTSVLKSSAYGLRPPPWQGQCSQRPCKMSGPVVTMATTWWHPGNARPLASPTVRLTGAPSPGAWPTPRSPACDTPFLSSTSQQPVPGGPGEGVWHLGWLVLCHEGCLAPHRHLAVSLASTTRCPVLYPAPATLELPNTRM